MNLIRYTIIIAFVLSTVSVQADAGPKFNDRPEIEFWKDGKRLESIDSILIVTDTGARIDSLYLDNPYQGFSENRMWEHNGRIRIDLRTKITAYKIHLYHNEREYISDQLAYAGSRSFFRFNLSDDGTLKNKHPLFYAKWINYFKSLGITLALELLLALLLLRNASVPTAQLLLFVGIANLITHPLLWYLDSHFNLNFLALELGVVLAEVLILSALLRGKVKLKSIIIFSLLANLTSLIIGTILYWIVL